jgi:beta-galactosidase
MSKIILFFMVLSCSIPEAEAQMSGTLNFNKEWEFVKDIDTSIVKALFRKDDKKIVWAQISLPHTPQIEALVISGNQWQGNCFYRKFFTVSSSDKEKQLYMKFDAAMHEADVYLNGRKIGKHLGGYLPFTIDITPYVKYAGENCLLIKLNNQDNPSIPPGKPLKDLDFNYYGGLYRNAYLIVKNRLYIPDPVQAAKVAGGGIRLSYQNVSERSAIIKVETKVKNDYKEPREVRVRIILYDEQGKRAGASLSEPAIVKNGEYGTFTQEITVVNPELWSPESPYLYKLSAEVMNKDRVTDTLDENIGIRTFRFANDGFYLNGKKLFLMGTNRHQEYPYIGYALSDHAQYRDAWKIRDAGFNFVRCSHYPPSPAFLDACDKLGIMVMDVIPGWQFSGDGTFLKNSFQDVRDMVRRDRNHPSIILWEASLNETGMSKEYMEKAHKIVHDELPGPDTYTCGWIDEVYDVFIPARQHSSAPDYWKNYNKDKPVLIAEYGDWEYYANNAGFNQTAFKDLQGNERTSRQLRGDGEKRLAQQALNYQESHNDNLRGKITGDANWLMFDYNRGYAPDLETSGIMDIFRLPKFSFYFYQSQFLSEKDKNGFGKPMVYIANYWTSSSPKNVVVYSNCEEVELFLNNQSIGKQKPDANSYSDLLIHPPFTFSLSSFSSGKLTAKAYINGKQAAETQRVTPGKPEKIKLSLDSSNKKLQADANDVVFIYALVTDANGTVVPDAMQNISFTVEGEAELIGGNPIKAEAGIATIILKAGTKTGKIKIFAEADGLKKAELEIQIL